jgi:hypothetical protein
LLLDAQALGEHVSQGHHLEGRAGHGQCIDGSARAAAAAANHRHADLVAPSGMSILQTRAGDK